MSGGNGISIEVLGLKAWVVGLKGKQFKDVNRALRVESFAIATRLRPLVSYAVSTSRAPQANAMSRTVRPKKDRVPVLSVGAVNPKFRTGFSRRGQNSKLRRGAIAHGVVYGPKGGKKSTAVDENYYRIPRNSDGGSFGKQINGRVFDEAVEVYFDAYRKVLKDAGFDVTGRRIG